MAPASATENTRFSRKNRIAGIRVATTTPKPTAWTTSTVKPLWASERAPYVVFDDAHRALTVLAELGLAAPRRFGCVTVATTVLAEGADRRRDHRPLDRSVRELLGRELPEGTSALLYSFGFVVATGLLHAAGILLGAAHRWPAGRQAVRAAGAGVALAGGFFLWRAIAS